MADQLYLSLWFPDFQLAALPAKLSAVMRQFSTVSGDTHVTAAAAYPISFSEPPLYQRVFVNDNRSEENSDSLLEIAVGEATEQLHDDTAYEFEMRWKLWTPDSGFGNPDGADQNLLDTVWRPEPATVKIIGFGPSFDDTSYEQNGHIRIDFGLDYPWVLDDEETDDDQDADAPPVPRTTERPSNILPFRTPDTPRNDTPAALTDAAQSIQRNVEMLLAFTLLVEKHCGISSRLLWTESGEPLAEKLIARLQRLS